MSDQGFQEKTEKPTPKRKKEAREKGQVAKSIEIGSVSILMGALGVFFFYGTWMFVDLKNIMTGFFQSTGSLKIDSIPDFNQFAIMVMTKFFLLLMPLFITIVVLGIAANLLQVGPMISLKPLSPNFSKLNVFKGLKRLVSLRSWVELVKSIAKILIVGGVAYLTVKNEIEKMPFLMNMDIIEILSFIGISTLKICLFACLVLSLLAILDYVYQKYQHEKDIKMTKQEIKEETKQSEGDPKVKQRIRRTQIEMLRIRMLNTIPEATVVITNPTHFAVAVKFELNKMPAPLVIAKGAGVLAARIKELAKENHIPIVENKPLAQLLFKTVDIGSYIPVELYQAVAEILAYIYRIQNQTK